MSDGSNKEHWLCNRAFLFILLHLLLQRRLSRRFYTMAGCKPIVISLGILLFLLMKTTLTEASLYPTKPIANTTYIAGQAALVTWVEDGVKPLLASLGRMKIDLYAGHNVSSANWTTACVRVWIWRLTMLGILLLLLSDNWHYLELIAFYLLGASI